DDQGRGPVPRPGPRHRRSGPQHRGSAPRRVLGRTRPLWSAGPLHHHGQPGLQQQRPATDGALHGSPRLGTQEPECAEQLVEPRLDLQYTGQQLTSVVLSAAKELIAARHRHEILRYAQDDLMVFPIRQAARMKNSAITPSRTRTKALT